MEWSQERLNEWYQKVQKRAVTDEEFRGELLADPNGAIEKELGTKLPDGFRIRIIESDPAYTATFVLPDLMGDELEDQDLDRVTGGFSAIIVASACAAAISVEFCAADACAARASIQK